MKKEQYVLLGLFLLTTQFIAAQFTIDGEFRPRTEYRHGFGSPIAEDADAGFGISTRARVNFGYADESYKVYLSLQDVMTWGRK
ncbi:hypothetical protein M601_014720 [Cellulophaga baltica 4]|nr:hypothetical protein M601_014720 [Cellulophaga baltica 4]